jgi:hypothetical protein
VPGPYDFSNQDLVQTDPAVTPPKSLRVEAWISATSLAKSRQVSFRIPFCGLDYYINQPMAYSEPTVTRMGSNTLNTVFRVSLPLVAPNQDVNVELDQTYYPNNPANALVPTSVTQSGATEYRFTVSTELISRYQNLVVRVGKGEPYVIPIPQEEKPPVKALIDTTAAPARVNKGKRGPVEWQGTGLDTIRTITFTPAPAPSAVTTDDSAPAPAAPAPAAVPSPITQEFAAYSDGTRLTVYLSDAVTTQAGKFALDCTTASGATFKIPLFVLDPSA